MKNEEKPDGCLKSILEIVGLYIGTYIASAGWNISIAPEFSLPTISYPSALSLGGIVMLISFCWKIIRVKD